MGWDKVRSERLVIWLRWGQGEYYKGKPQWWRSGLGFSNSCTCVFSLAFSGNELQKHDDIKTNKTSMEDYGCQILKLNHLIK